MPHPLLVWIQKQLRRLFTIYSALPLPLSGAAGAAASAMAEREQYRWNTAMTTRMESTEENVSILNSTLAAVRVLPTRESLCDALTEILGCVPDTGRTVKVVLNPQTVEELQPFVRNSLLTLESDGSMCSIGTGCWVGNDFEDLKRPYGMGCGFYLTVCSHEQAN